MEEQNRNEGVDYDICFFMVTENLIKNKEPILDEDKKTDIENIKNKVSEWYQDVYLKPVVTESKSYVHTNKISEYIDILNEKEKSKKKGDPVGKSGAKPYFTRMNFYDHDVDVVIKVFDARKNELKDKYDLFTKGGEIETIRINDDMNNEEKIKAIIEVLDPYKYELNQSEEVDRINSKNAHKNKYSRSAIEPLLVSKLMSQKNTNNRFFITPEIYDVGFLMKKGTEYIIPTTPTDTKEEGAILTESPVDVDRKTITGIVTITEDNETETENQILKEYIVNDNDVRLNFKIICELISTTISFHKAIKKEGTENEFIGCHRDLHPGNVVLCNIPQKYTLPLDEKYYENIHVKFFDFDLSIDDKYTKGTKCQRYPPGGLHSVFGNHYNWIDGTRKWYHNKNGIGIFGNKLDSKPFRKTDKSICEFIMKDADLYQLFTYIYVILKKSGRDKNNAKYTKILKNFLESNCENGKSTILNNLETLMKTKYDEISPTSQTAGGLKRRKTKRKSKNKKRVTRRKRNKRK
jgi:hypothetical protein